MLGLRCCQESYRCEQRTLAIGMIALASYSCDAFDDGATNGSCILEGGAAPHLQALLSTAGRWLDASWGNPELLRKQR